MTKEDKILEEVEKTRETGSIVKALESIGLEIIEEYQPQKGIVGEKLKIKPVRIGMPGESDEGFVFGPPKRDTPYPIDSIRVIREKGGNYLVGLFSSNAGKRKGDPYTPTKPITWRKLQFIPITEPAQQKLLPSGPERKLLPPGPERKLLPPGPERKQLTTGEPWRYALPPGRTEDTGTPGWFVLSMAVHPKKAGITTPAAYTSHSYPPNKNVTVKQKPNSGSEFDHWELDNVNVGPGMLIGSSMADGTYFEIMMDQNHSITAVYKTSGSEGNISIKVASKPFSQIPVKINGSRVDKKGKNHETTAIETITKGSVVEVEVPAEWIWKGILYKFSEWDDGSTDNIWRGQVFEPTTIVATYQKLMLIIDSSPEGVVVTINEIDVGRTPHKHSVIENTQYNVKVPKSHLYESHEEKKLYVFEKWEDGSEKETRNVYVEDKDVHIIAYYKDYDKVTHTDRPRIGSPYQGGAQGAGDTAHGLLRTSLLKGKIERDTEHAQHGKMKTKDGWVDVDNPHLRSAINKGKRILDGYAQAEYRRLFEWDFNLKWANQKFPKKKGERVVKLEGLKKDAKDSQKELKRLMRKQHGFWKGSGMNAMDMINQTDKHASEAGSPSAIDPAMLKAMQQERDILKKFIDGRDKFEKDFNNDLNAASAQLRKYLEDKAEVVTIGIARRWKIPINSEDQEALKGELKGYASEIAEDFVTRGRTTAFRGLRFLKGMSRGMMTVGDVYENLLHNLINIIIGPWTIGTIIVMIQFYFVLSWIGYYPLLLLILPAMGAVILFIINIEAVQQPFDFITHLASGAMLAYAVIIFMYSLGLTQANIGNTWFFVLGGLILFLFIGVFQIYQVGGYKSVRTLAVVVLVFGYVALGPYSGYYQIIKEQVKAPVSMAFNALKGAVGDVWLLATNPTEFYARQQMKNVRPENPLDYPKALEFMSVDALPESVPGWEEFSVITVIKNEGKDYEAKDIRTSASCNTFCEEKNVKIDIDRTKSFNIAAEASDRIMYEGFVALSLQEERQAEVRFAKVSVNMTYSYSTDSSIFVEVMSRDEIKRSESEGKSVYRPVGAVGKSTPAQISLNVGPQPLEGNKNAILLVSVLNTRPDATIRLYKGDQISLHFPSIIGTFLTEGNDDKKVDCTGKVSCEFTDGSKENVACTVLPDEDKAIEILQYKFQSIFFFTCKFRTAAVQDVKTGLVTASMEKFEVNVMKDKQILVTPPLGSYPDADEKTCESCGKGIMPCTRSKCETMKGTKCYFIEHPMLPGECKSCSSARCENFLSDEQCSDAKRVCGLPCQWDPNSGAVVNNVKQGACVSKGAVVEGSITENIIAASVAGFSRDEAETILKLVDQESGFRHCCADAGKRTSSSCVQVAELWKTCPENKILMSYDGSSFGIMQLNKKVHPAWYNPYNSLSECKRKYANQNMECDMIYTSHCENGKKTAYDTDCNIWLGVGYLEKLKEQYANGGLNYNVPGDGYKDCVRKPSKHYDGLDAALRAYNGLGCTDEIYEYVENLKNRDVGGYKGLIDKHYPSGSAQGTTTPSGTLVKGSASYCTDKINGGWGYCTVGQGGCNDSNGKCDSTAADATGAGLGCRNLPGVTNKVCCYVGQSDSDCKAFYDAFIKT